MKVNDKKKKKWKWLGIATGRKKKVKDPKVLGIDSQETIEDKDEEENQKKED